MSCGRSYDYDIEGCCPECGAFNRPPHRQTIEADGQIHVVREKPGTEPWQAKSAGKKVCYENGSHKEKTAQRKKGTQPVPSQGLILALLIFLFVIWLLLKLLRNYFG